MVPQIFSSPFNTHFSQSKFDYTPFTKGPSSSFIALVVYVYDIIIALVGLVFSASSALQLRAFSDADWATCPDSRSLLPVFMYFSVILISSKTKKQTIISRSSAEYRALAETASELI